MSTLDYRATLSDGDITSITAGNAALELATRQLSSSYDTYRQAIERLGTIDCVADGAIVTTGKCSSRALPELYAGLTRAESDVAAAETALRANLRLIDPTLSAPLTSLRDTILNTTASL
jgi:hypothetical protein